MTIEKLRQIAISEHNYQLLKKQGRAGDSFNDVLTKILQKKELLQSSKLGSSDEIATNVTSHPSKEEHICE